MPDGHLRFGEFDLDTKGFQLRRGGAKVRLERIPMEMLIILARSGGRLVERNEVVAAIWGKDHFLETDSAINTAIRKLRRVLGDNARNPAFIETVPGRGYRFLQQGAGTAAGEVSDELYGRGRHFWNRKTPESYTEAIRLFQQSIDANPANPLPYAGLSKAWIMLGIHGLQPAHDVYPRARAAAAKALELDDSLAEAYAALGDIAKGYDWDWRVAEEHYLMALERDAKCALAHQWYANLLSIVGRHAEALEHAVEAQALDPLSVGPVGFVGFTRFRARQFRRALHEAQSALTLDPGSPIVNWFLGQILMAMGRCAEAIQVLSIAVDRSRGAPMYLSALGYAYGELGESQRAAEILGQLLRRMQDGYISPFDLAIVCAGLQRSDDMYRHLESAFEQKVMRLTEVEMPMFDRFQRDSRHKDLVARLRLTVKSQRTD